MSKESVGSAAGSAPQTQRVQVAVSDALWLEVANVRLERTVTVQFKADRSDERERRWWPVEVSKDDGTPSSAGADLNRTYKQISDALDNKRVVLGKVAAEAADKFAPVRIRIQFAS